MRSFGKIPYFRLPQTAKISPTYSVLGGDERLLLIFVIKIIPRLRKKYIEEGTGNREQGTGGEEEQGKQGKSS
ncbi:hypothetical protein PL8927_830143 [Planktothrix serta PCC 8927]|uniref:Uncharacterized protein n=1 Tax=Planktothrix serta PCC 8927 TaxID=671068 RepID=A0A7Z9BXV6_9CYAN|nr:hypothetical protein PL8927_830143 [Planktothrix serta PCC 8927]